MIAVVNCRNRVSGIFLLPGYLIEQRIHVEAVNYMTEPTMNTKLNALDHAGAAGSQENARRPERGTPHHRKNPALTMALPADKEKASAWLAL